MTYNRRDVHGGLYFVPFLSAAAAYCGQEARLTEDSSSWLGDLVAHDNNERMPIVFSPSIQMKRACFLHPKMNRRLFVPNVDRYSNLGAGPEGSSVFKCGHHFVWATNLDSRVSATN